MWQDYNCKLRDCVINCMQLIKKTAVGRKLRSKSITTWFGWRRKHLLRLKYHLHFIVVIF